MSDETDIAILKMEVSSLKGEVSELQGQMTRMVTTANKATGGFIVLVALGSIITWGTTLGEKVSRWLH